MTDRQIERQMLIGELTGLSVACYSFADAADKLKGRPDMTAADSAAQVAQLRNIAIACAVEGARSLDALNVLSAMEDTGNAA